MKRLTLLLLSLLLAFGSLEAQNKDKKMKIAVMDFRAGVGVAEGEVQGLSDMLINTLYESGKFSIVERSQIDQVLKEQKFQASELTYEQVAKVGRILGVKAVLVGTVNFLAEHKNLDGSVTGEYNVDVRAVDVESGEVVTTAGAAKSSGSTYRAMMEKIGRQLAANLMEEEPEPEPVVVEQTKPKKDSFRKSGFTLRPELGFVYGKRSWSSDYSESYISMIGPTADLAIGYQAGPHFFFGAVVGYGGEYRYYKEYYEYEYLNSVEIDEDAYSLIPIMADVRWYIINHKYTFVVDVQGGINLNKRMYPILRANAGFAFGNWEAMAGVQSKLFDSYSVGFNFNLAYRFGNIRWW